MLFIDAYMATNNGTQAAIAAGYSANGAGVAGCRLLKRDNVQEEITRRRQTLIEKLDLSPERVLNRLQIEADGLGPDTSAGARIKATELLGKHLGMFTEKREVEHSGSIDGAGRFEVVIVDP